MQEFVKKIPRRQRSVIRLKNNTSILKKSIYFSRKLPNFKRGSTNWLTLKINFNFFQSHLGSTDNLFLFLLLYTRQQKMVLKKKLGKNVKEDSLSACTRKRLTVAIRELRRTLPLFSLNESQQFWSYRWYTNRFTVHRFTNAIGYAFRYVQLCMFFTCNDCTVWTERKQYLHADNERLEHHLAD